MNIKNESGIYIIISKITKEKYIGASIKIKDRLTNHYRQLSYNIHKNYYLQNHYNNYGKDSFFIEILEYCNKESLLSREQYYVDLLKPTYNICSIVNTKQNVKLSDKRRFLNDDSHKIYLISLDNKIIKEFWSIVEAMQYLKLSRGGIIKILKNKYSMKGFFLTADLKELPLKVPDNYSNNRTILQYDDNFNIIREYNCPKEIKFYTNINYKAVWSAINRKGKAGGFYWKYK